MTTRRLTWRLISATTLSLVLVVRPCIGETRCDISVKFNCEPTGCAPSERTVFNMIDPDRGIYARCDMEGCDEYLATMSVSGDHVNIALPERGMLAKIALDDGAFVEVATLGMSTLVSFGTCRVAGD